MLRERRALRRARHVVPAAQELGLRPAARSKARVVRELLSRGMDGCVSPACGQLNRCDRGHLQSSVPSRVPLLESRSPIITSAIEALVPLELRPFSPSRLLSQRVPSRRRFGRFDEGFPSSPGGQNSRANKYACNSANTQRCVDHTRRPHAARSRPERISVALLEQLVPA